MRSVSEVVWAAAHGKGMPVPYRACKLTRYLQDTLCPSGKSPCRLKQLLHVQCHLCFSPVLNLAYLVFDITLRLAPTHSKRHLTFGASGLRLYTICFAGT